MAKGKNRSAYKKALGVYVIITFILVVLFLIYIYTTLKTYESKQISNFIKNEIASISDNTLKGYLRDNNLDIKLLEDYKKLINDEDINVVKISEDNYEVILDDRVMFEVLTKYVKSETKLGMFSYEVRDILEVKPNLKRGLYYIDVIIPSNYKLYVNDFEVSDYSKREEYKNLDYMYASSSMPYLVTYSLDKIKKSDKIKVIDEYGNESNLNKSKYTYKLDKNYINVDTITDAVKYLSSEVDVLEFARNWSLYLSRDLKGTSWGFNDLKTYFILDTPMYERASNWAKNVDILFISKHTLKNPVFTNEDVSNFTIYSKDAFSCEVYLEKNMIVAGKDQVDIMHDYIYFVKENGVWKVVNIKAGE